VAANPAVGGRRSSGSQLARVAVGATGSTDAGNGDDRSALGAVDRCLTVTVMGTRLAVIGMVALVAAACGGGTPPLPVPGPPKPDTGFAIAPRRPCSPEVQKVMAARQPDAITRAAAQGANFTCGPELDRLPLDEAIRHDDPAVVRALLEAGADPNARWSSHGDRFPLQGAIEAQIYWGRLAHRDEIIRLLLRYGADPNARWCPFESRGVWAGMPTPPCRSEQGVTPLLMATALDDPDTACLLVQAGGDPRLEDRNGANALDYVRSEAVFECLVRTMFRAVKSPDSEALRYLERRYQTKNVVLSYPPGPWDETPLSRAIWSPGDPGIPPPPPRPRKEPPVNGRVRLLLRLGADPNQRLRWAGVDWTPLAVALSRRDSSAVEALLASGADPNARWCVGVRWRGPRPWTPEAGCEISTGTSPLMFAASTGDRELLGLLLSHGANETLRDWKGRTALDYATKSARGWLEKSIRGGASDRRKSPAPNR
jgi:uncharacterized protein